MQQDDFTIRTMSLSELGLALDWAAAEGWNPGVHDAECFYAADPQGFLIGLLGEQPVAVISVVKYGSAFGFLGLYIVKPEFRGQGHGLRLWNAGMARLAGGCVGLDGVVAQQANYQRSGFELAYRNVRYQGQASGVGAPDAAVVPLASVSLKALCTYDEAVFAAPRVAFLQAWVEQGDACALGVLRDGGLVGYGVLRRCRVGSKIGPLFADDADTAERLFNALSAHATPHSPLFIDVPEKNTAALALVRRHSMVAGFETARMYAGASPPQPIERVFGLTSFELG
ncbi:MAG: GNAT family N-acetyltransferase [Burkholderiaceae bacterium]